MMDQQERDCIDRDSRCDLETAAPRQALGIPAWQALGMIGLWSLVVTLPVLVWGFPLGSNDGHSHLKRTFHFSRQFWQGDLYPRWLTDMNDGFGSPSLYFDPPLPHYLATVTHPFFPESQLGVYSLAVAAFLAFLLSGVAFYYWARQLVSPLWAIIGALIYVCAPYHLAVDLYRRGAFAELVSFIWLPLLLISLSRVADRRSFGIPFLSACFWGLTTSHLLITLLLCPIIPLYYLVACRGKVFGFLTRVAPACLLGAVLSLPYVVPALTLQQHTLFERQWSGSLNVFNNFLFNPSSISSVDLSKRYGQFMHILLLVYVLLLVASWTLGPRSRQLYLWIGLSAGYLFLATSPSSFMYHLVPPLAKIQFPWRVFAAAEFCVVASIIVALDHVSRSGRKWMATIAMPGAFVSFALMASVLAALGSFPDDRAPALERVKRAHEFPWKNTRWSRLESIPGKFGPAELVITTGNCEVNAVDWDTDQIVVDVVSTKPATLSFRQFYFPNWRARILSGAGTASIEVEHELGNLAVSLSEVGTHRVAVYREYFWEEKIGYFFGFVGLTAYLVVLLGSAVALQRRVKWQGEVSMVSEQMTLTSEMIQTRNRGSSRVNAYIGGQNLPYIG